MSQETHTKPARDGPEDAAPAFVRWFEDLGSDDVAEVGGKNASLGEMIATLADAGVAVPPGYATTAEAYRRFIKENDLAERMRDLLDDYERDEDALASVGERIRGLFTDGRMPDAVERAIRDAYAELAERRGRENPPVAVRSSATAEDLPEASFAGQQETFLNVRGAEGVLDACRRCFASLFTDRAISYRAQHGFDHMQVALSVGVQEMVRASKAGSGVMFTIDTDSGFPRVVVIDAAWGLGETVVGGEVDPDSYTVFKPLLDREGLTPILEKRRGAKRIKAVITDDADEPVKRTHTSEDERRKFVLSDDEILRLARWGRDIEDHYERPMDIEWAKDAESGELFIVQARPETVQSQRGAGMTRYALKERSEVLVRGLAIGDAIGAGRARVMERPDEGDRFESGDVLVARATDPDWGPIMQRASAIVTDRGGRTAHAAIVSRELGIPAVVGTGDATSALEDGAEITISCAEGSEGLVYRGRLEFEAEEIDLSDVPETRTRIMMNIASPSGAFRWHQIPCSGVGLARMEFIVMNAIKAHPMALVRFDEVEDDDARARIQELTAGYDDKAEYFVDTLAQGIAMIAASRYPHPVIVRTSDFKTNEYARLIGGEAFEPEEENPMLGVRGASRYTRDLYRPAFALECRALKRVREVIGLDNVVVMIPFCRTLKEADAVLGVMAEEGLERGLNDLAVYVMAEIPSNVILAEAFAERFDGFSIGTNDLTQLVLGVDRDSSALSDVFDERDEAVKRSIQDLIERAHAAGRPVGICGQAPSDHPDFAAFLVECGIDSISLNPDSVLDATRSVANAEREQGRRAEEDGGGA